MENRGQQHHKERLIEAIKEELSSILAGELSDPRIGLATMTDAVLAPGGKSMRVYVFVPGDEQEQKRTIAALTAATGFIRHQLAERLQLRQSPDLSFHVDNSEQYGARIDELLHRIEKRKRKPGE